MGSANITVLGVNDGMGGLKESLAKFRNHHKEVGDALMNISGVGTATGEAVDKDEPRPGYTHHDWPKMMYHADGRSEIVLNAVELKERKETGFRLEPYARPQVAVLDPATEKKHLMEIVNQATAEKTILAEKLEKLMERLQALENGKSAK